MFNDIIGQDGVKKKLTFFLDCYQRGGVSPNLLFIAPKGCGKTMFAIQYGKELEALCPDKKVRLVNCSAVKNVKGFFESIVIPHVVDKDVTFIFDEASELPRDVTMALLTILNPNPSNTSTFSYADYTADFDFKRQTFLFATSEPQKVFHALVDRLTRIDLQEYSNSDLAEVVQKATPTVKYEKGILDSISEILRGNPRQATKMGNNIQNFLATKTEFAAPEWESLKASLGILPLGINENELNLLKILKERTQCTLTALAATTGMTRISIQRDIELYLLKKNLIRIETGGRELTQKGMDFVRSVSKT